MRCAQRPLCMVLTRVGTVPACGEGGRPLVVVQGARGAPHLRPAQRLRPVQRANPLLANAVAGCVDAGHPLHRRSVVGRGPAEGGGGGGMANPVKRGDAECRGCKQGRTKPLGGVGPGQVEGNEDVAPCRMPAAEDSRLHWPCTVRAALVCVQPAVPPTVTPPVRETGDPPAHTTRPLYNSHTHAPHPIHPPQMMLLLFVPAMSSGPAQTAR